MAGIGIGFFALYLAITLWVYFDAVEHGRPAIPWSLATFFLVWFFALPLILYAANRDKDRTPAEPGSGKRLTLYIVSLTGLVMTAVGGSILLGATIANALTDSRRSNNDYKDAVASGIVAIMVGGAAWLSQWLTAERRLAGLSDAEFRPTFRMHSVYVNTVFGVFWISTALTALWFLGGLVTDALGNTSVSVEEWMPALGPLAVFLAIIGYHYVAGSGSPAFVSARERYQVRPADPEPAAAEERKPAGRKRSPTRDARFCSNCGAGVRATDTFCPSCGQQLG